MLDLAQGWRRVLKDEREHARPIVTMLLDGRVTLTPTAPKTWHLHGVGTLAGLFEREIVPSVWRPHRDSVIGCNYRLLASRPEV